MAVEGDLVQMGALIGAGLACTGMGGAAVGVGHVVGNYLAGGVAQSKRGRWSNRNYVHRYRVCRGFGNFLVPCCAFAYVRTINRFEINHQVRAGLLVRTFK